MNHLLLCLASVVLAACVSPQPTTDPLADFHKKQEQERIQKMQSALAEVKGKKFWITPDTDPLKSYTTINRRICKTPKIACADDDGIGTAKVQTFTVVGVTEDPSALHLMFYEVLLQDGRKGYMFLSPIEVYQSADQPLKQGVRIGMTKEQVIQSNWGRPKSINQTITNGIEHEQWVYGSRSYLYFTNGKLTAIQSP